MANCSSITRDDSNVSAAKEDEPGVGQYQWGRVVSPEEQLAAEDAEAQRGCNLYSTVTEGFFLF